MDKGCYTVILIEDNESEALLFQEYLNDQFCRDFEVIHVSSISEFRTVNESIRSDVIVLDLSLPDSEGIETILKVKSMADPIPVIVLTGEDDDDMAVKSIKKGAQEYLSKSQLTTLSIVRIIVQAIERQKIRNAMLLDRKSQQGKEKLFKEVIETLGCGIVRVDSENKILFSNRRSKELLGHSFCRVGRDFQHDIPQDGRTLIQGGDPGATKALEMTAERCPVQENCVVITVYDVSKHIESRENLMQVANRDSLTGLYNRQYFDRSLKRTFERSKRSSSGSFALCLIDCDRFKDVNDSLGHDKGDELLREVAYILEKGIRPTDCLARIGGDEFAIILDDVESWSDITTVPSRIVRSFEKELVVSDTVIKTSVSIGIAKYDNEYDSIEQIFKDADRALYSAKQQGRNCYELFDISMRADAIMESATMDKLRAAIDHDALSLEFQPICVAHSGAVMGYESLLRWKSSNKQTYFPAEVFEYAEKTGLSSKIDFWVFKDALARLRTMRLNDKQIPPLKLNINLSLQTLLTQGVDRILASWCDQCGIERSDISFEIRQSDLSSQDSRQNAMKQVSMLKSAGFQILVDNFGSVNYDLAMILESSPHVVELGRPIVDRIDSTEYQGLVRGIVGYCHNLDIKVLAEGVENQMEFEMMTELGVDYMKGEYIRQYHSDSQGCQIDREYRSGPGDLLDEPVETISTPL